MKIVRASAEHAVELTDIAYRAKRHWGYSEEWIQRWRDVLTISPDFITREETYCAVEENAAIGCHALIRADTTLRLEHLWVLPRAMHRGIGRALFQHAMARARTLGFRRVEIESDPHAEAFYLRMGAERAGTSLSEVCGQKRELPFLTYFL
ncbi:MAG: GNAT family N-acetyltransferase [Chthoniobacterales bacterium]